MAKTPEEIEVDLKRIEAGLSREQIDGVWNAVNTAYGEAGRIRVDLVRGEQDLQRTLIKAAADFDRAVNSGVAAERVRAVTNLRKVLMESKVDYARAAYAPDVAAVQRIKQAFPLTGASAADRARRARAAWEMFYTQFYVAGAPGLLGTYRELEASFGDPGQFITEFSPEAREAKSRADKDLATALAAAADADAAFRYVADVDDAYKRFAAERGMDLADPRTEAEFASVYAIDKNLPGTIGTTVMNALKEAALRPELLNAPSRELAVKQIEALEAQGERFLGMLPSGEGTAGADTERDKLAAFIGREDVQAWGAENGLTLGKTYPLTDELRAEVEAGRYPGSVYTKYGVYIPGPDDRRAVMRAASDLQRDPSKRLFRAAGAMRGDRVPVEVVLRGEQPVGEAPKVVRVSAIGGTASVVGQAADGSYFASDDEGKTWKSVSKDAADVLIAKAGPLEDVEPIDTGIAPPAPEPEVIKGVRQRALFTDRPGGVRFIDSEGNLRYLPPEQVAEVRTLPGAPAERKPLGDVVRKGTYNRVMGRAEKASGAADAATFGGGGAPEREPVVFREPRMPKPDRRTGTFTQEAPPAVPATIPSEDEFKAAQAKASAPKPRPAVAEVSYDLSRPDPSKPVGIARRGEAPPVTPATDTTVTTSSVPVATDPRRKMFRRKPTTVEPTAPPQE